MKSFKVYLFEMSILDAKKVMEFVSGFTDKELKAKYRRLSMQNHPDRGGSVEAMKKVNVAYDLLKVNVGGSSSTGNNKYNDEWHNNVNKKYNNAASIVRDDLVKNLDLKAYTDYFEKIFNEPFTHKVEKLSPTDAEINKVMNGRITSSIHGVFYEVTFSNKDNTKVFELGLYVNLSDLMKTSKGLGASNTTYPMGVFTYAYMDSRKVKITSRDYTNTTKKNVFTKPSVVFPKTKIVGKKKGVFKKSHMLSALKSEIQAINSGDWWYVPLGDNKYLGMYRSVMSRGGIGRGKSTAIWNIGGGGLYERNEKNTRFIEVKDHKMKFIGFLENEGFLDILRKIKTYSGKDAIKFLYSEYNKLTDKKYQV